MHLPNSQSDYCFIDKPSLHVGSQNSEKEFILGCLGPFIHKIFV